jgi:Protein of unknown function (DUF1573)
MKKIIFILALCINLIANAQSGAKIEFKEETINYGVVYKGEDSGKRVFEFTNTGDAPLIIKDAKSTCGCTVPSFSKEEIAPGKTGTIEVQYNMNVGVISKTITVETNAVNKEKGFVALRIKGTVLQKEEKSILEKKPEGPRAN